MIDQQRLSDERNFNSNQAVLKKHALQYTQRSVTNLNLSGLHFLDKESNWKLNWTLSPTASRISDPDIRSTALRITSYNVCYTKLLRFASV